MLINPECLVGVALLQVLADILSVELPVKPTPGLWSTVSVSSRDIFSIAQPLHLNILPFLCNVSVILKIHNLTSVYCTEIPPLIFRCLACSCFVYTDMSLTVFPPPYQTVLVSVIANTT